jgi:hypothetical protein
MKKINLDEWLTEQEKNVVLATVEALPNNASEVKVTPWIAGRGCACHFGLILAKKCIREVKLTGQRHPCCGKMLNVVEITFKEGSTVPLEEVMSQLFQRAARTLRRPPRPFR